MHQDPLRVFPECGVAKYMQDALPFVVGISRIDAPPRVVKYPVHEFVLLDELRIGDAETIGLMNAYEQQHDTHQDDDGIPHQVSDLGAHQDQERDDSKSDPENNFRQAHTYER